MNAVVPELRVARIGAARFPSGPDRPGGWGSDRAGVPLMLLDVRDLRVRFRLGRGAAGGYTEAVGRRGVNGGGQGVSFEVPENTTVALVGESGSGKSVTAMSILNLLPDNAERAGAIRFQGRDLLAATLPELQALRGKEIACVFQDPMTSLNPVFSVGEQLVEPLRIHLGLGCAPGPRARAERCSPRSACPSRSAGSTPIRTSCRAASSSA